MPDSPSAPGAPRELQRTLGLWRAVAVVIGSTIGSGIFRAPAGIAAKLPGPLPMLSVWAAGGLFAICGALTLAEVASALPETGGLYVFCRDGWGRLAGFLFGWGQFAMIRAASLGAISIVFSEYFFRVAGLDPQNPANLWTVRWFAAFAIALTAFFNIRGVSLAAMVSNLTVLAKYGGPVFIVLVAFCLRPRAPGDGRPLHARGSRGQLHARRIRPGARLDAVGVRRVGRPRLQRGRSRGPGEEPPARAHRGHARCRRDLPPRDPRLPRGPSDRPDPRLEARRRRRRAGGPRAGRRRVRVRHRDDLPLRHAQHGAVHEAMGH